MQMQQRLRDQINRCRERMTGLLQRIVVVHPLLSITLLALVLAGCGGGGSDPEPGPPPPPPANVAPAAVAQANLPDAWSSQVISLSGVTSTDSDGSVVTYSWAQTAGPAVTLAGNPGVSVTFTAPPVASSTPLVFRLTIVDDDGASAEASVTVNVAPASISMAVSLVGARPFSVDDELVSIRRSEAQFSGATVTPTSITWSSSVAGALAGDLQGLDAMLAPGVHDISARADFGNLGTITRTLTARVLPRMGNVTTFQSTPAAGAAVVVPVVMINHIPTRDGITVDQTVTGPSGTIEWPGGSIDSLQSWVSTIATRAKFMLEEGSRFRGYQSIDAKPHAGYRIVSIYNFYEEMPAGFPDPALPGNSFPDYHAILARIPAQELVEGSTAVREIWLNSYHFGKMSLNESNMASALTGDISNSYRTNGDLPIFTKTYVLYQNNFTRSHAEAVHNHGHQIEAVLAYINQRYDGNTNLFWRNYVGLNASGAFEPGRCGATHFPLNAVADYDYLNATNLVQSDCEDWRPDGTGVKKTSTLSTWAEIQYAWPAIGTISQRQEAQWYIYWMQNLPGRDSAIPYNATTLENWWRFIVEWDDSIVAGRRLYK